MVEIRFLKYRKCMNDIVVQGPICWLQTHSKEMHMYEAAITVSSMRKEDPGRQNSKKQKDNTSKFLLGI